jgi:hypothetical protein
VNTPSHLLMTLALRQSTKSRLLIPTSAVIWGSIGPDLPLYLLSLGGYIWYHLILGWSKTATFRHMYDTLYFSDLFWLTGHNFLHAPLMLLGLALICWKLKQKLGLAYQWCLWFLAACALHSTVDIFTHVDDGPLLFFPLNWQWRFESAVSYWDHRHFGSQFIILELALDLFLVAYLLQKRGVIR